MARKSNTTMKRALVAVILITSAAIGLKYWNRPHAAHARRPATSKGQEVPVSLVLLLRQPRALDNATVRAAAKRAWGVDLSSQDPASTEFVVGDTTSYILETGGHRFTMNLNLGQYEELKAADQIDPRLAEAVGGHGAWLAIDVLRDDDAMPVKQAYQYVGKLAAEFLDNNCLAIYATQVGALGLNTPATVTLLRGDDPRGGGPQRGGGDDCRGRCGDEGGGGRGEKALAGVCGGVQQAHPGG